MRTQAVRLLAARALVLASPLAGCESPAEHAPAQAQAQAQPAQPSPGWPVFVDEFLAGYFKANPAFAVNQGRHEFDGRLPDWSEEGIKAEILRLQRLRERAADFRATALDEAQRFERDYLVQRIDNDLFWLAVAEQPFRNPAWYSDALNPGVYVVRPYAAPEVRLRAFIRYARSVVAAAPQIQRNLKLPLPETFTHYGVALFSGLADFYRKDARLAFAGVADGGLQTELVAASEEAATALGALAARLEADLPNSTAIVPLGPARYAKMLELTEGVRVPLPALEAAGRADLERNLAALREACAQYAPGASVQECVERVAAKKPAGGPVARAREQLVELRQFLVEHEVVTIPGTEEAQVAEAPAFNRQNFAYIEIPGPYESSLPSVYYIAPPDPRWPQAEQDAYAPGEAQLLFTSLHEVWPGHFLQYLHANRSRSMIGRLFVGYAFAEGWAHYAEELLWEEGLRGDPEAHIGQLTNALLRNVRLLASLEMHLHGMKVAEAEQMFRELAFQDPGNARQQAARGTYDPAYLNYTLGKLMIRKLRTDWCASRGGARAWKEFHDEFLSFGGPPIPLVRRAMLPGDKEPVL
jgi:uncharacterized protein (DUF885 family)